MTVNYTSLLALGQPVTGTESGTWGDDVNNAVTSYLDIAVAGTLTLTGDGAVTLANTQGTNTATNIGATTAQYHALKIVGPLTATKVITAPSSSRSYVVINTDTTYGVTVKASGQTGVTIAANTRAVVVFNGTDYVLVSGSTVAALSGLGTGVATALAVNTGSAGAFVVNGGALGTPSSGTLTNATGLPISTGVAGLGTNVATALGVNVGSAGAFVVNGGALGTPSSGTVTNLTGTASININGTVGATTPTTGSFTTVTTSGVITGPDGSASAPTYSFSSSGNTDNGMYLSAANEVSLATAGTKFLTLTSDGRLYGTAIHNNSGAVTGTTNQYIASGTFTPTLGDSTNVASSSINSAQWIRVGNVVTVSGRLTVELTDFANPAEFTLTLPIAVSGSPSAGNFAGVIACTTFDNAASGITGINAPPWKVIMGITITGGSGLVPWSYHYTYRIT